MMNRIKALLLVGLVCLLIASGEAKKKKSKKEKKPREKPEWAKNKKIADFNDNDLERLYEQWEETDEDPLPLDELPDYDPRKPQPQIDFAKLDMKNPEAVLKATKKGKSLMIFVRVSGKPERAETEQVTSIWQTGLWNSHIQAERFMLEDDRVIFMFQDGEHAFEAKDYLVEQERCEEVQVEQKTYCGIYAKKCPEEQKRKEAEEKAKKEAKKKKEEDEKARKEREEKEKDEL